MNTQALSVDVITHRLKIKGLDTKYIPKKFAEHIFAQIMDERTEHIEIINPENLTYIRKYKSEIELVPIEWEEKNTEDIIYASWLNKDQKESLRVIFWERRKDNKPVTENIIREIIAVKFYS